VGAEIGNHFALSKVESSEMFSLDLRHAECGTLYDDIDSWPGFGKIFLGGFIYSNISAVSSMDAKKRISWLRRQPTHQCLPQSFEQLAEILRQAGHEEAAIEVLIEKNRDQTRRLAKFSLTWFWHHLFDLFAGYGYRPKKAFGWSLGIVLMGLVFFHFGYAHGLITPTKADAYEPKGSKTISVNYPVFSAAIYSMESFVPLIKLQIADSYAPNANLGKVNRISSFTITDGSLLRDYLWLHIIAGWFLTTLWIGGLTGLIRR